MDAVQNYPPPSYAAMTAGRAADPNVRPDPSPTIHFLPAGPDAGAQGYVPPGYPPPQTYAYAAPAYGAQQAYPPRTGPDGALVPVQTVVVSRTSNSSLDRMKVMIPKMPVWLAVICCILNIFPGAGTILAAIAVLFPCTNVGDPASTRVGSFCVNFLVGVAQFVTAWLIIGWVWSIFWGVLFVMQSLNRRTIVVSTTTNMSNV